MTAARGGRLVWGDCHPHPASDVMLSRGHGLVLGTSRVIPFSGVGEDRVNHNPDRSILEDMGFNLQLALKQPSWWHRKGRNSTVYSHGLSFVIGAVGSPWCGSFTLLCETGPIQTVEHGHHCQPCEFQLVLLTRKSFTVASGVQGKVSGNPEGSQRQSSRHPGHLHRSMTSQLPGEQGPGPPLQPHLTPRKHRSITENAFAPPRGQPPAGINGSPGPGPALRPPCGPVG